MTWRTQAKCRTLPTRIFYPEQGANATLAKQICAGCPVRSECEDEGRDEPKGVWGGKSPNERGGHGIHNRGEVWRLYDVAACDVCDARWWAPKRLAASGAAPCPTCRTGASA